MNVLSAESDIERVAIPRKSWEQLVLAAGNMVRARQLQKKQRQFRINKAKLQDMRRLEVNGKLRIKRNRLQKNCL